MPSGGGMSSFLGENPKVCVVIPTYNERENISSLINEILNVASKQNLNLEILVVDDNSPDGTADLVEEIARNEASVHLLKRPGKMGLGSAYKEGFTKAIKDFGAEILVQMDADGSHNPSYLPTLIGKILEGYDVVVGSRYIPGGSVVGWGVKRRLISFGGNKLARLFCGVKIRDATSGYRALRAEAVEKMGLSRVISSGYAFQVETLFLAKRAGLKICEIPITFVDRIKARSKLGVGEIFRFAWLCVRLLLKRVFGRP